MKKAGKNLSTFYRKSAQIWVETVIYTLIALILIGVVLAFVTPKIEEAQDRVVIEQSIEMMGSLENTITSVGDVPGNKRVVNVNIRKGSMIIDGENDKIKFELESDYEYSELGEEINISDISIITERSGSTNIITLSSDYSEYDILYNGNNETKSVSQSSTPYKISVENLGISGKKRINFVVN